MQILPKILKTSKNQKMQNTHNKELFETHLSIGHSGGNRIECL